jgi:ABC-type transport system substrate-binding protein
VTQGSSGGRAIAPGAPIDVEAAPTRRLRLGRLAVPMLVAAVVAVLAGACGTGSDDQTAGTQVSGVQENQVVQPTEKPTPGGSLTYGLEADSDGFDPTANRWAISGTMIGLAVYDPLAAYDADSVPKPYLAESIEPSSDFKTWTVTLRPNITFHDGSPLTSEALTTLYAKHLASPLTGAAFKPTLTDVTATGPLTAEFHMSTPWVAFPSVLTAQAGVVPSPASITAGADGTVPGSTKPVGTGPFQYESWEQGTSWKGTKYAKYWRKDADGVQLPYLDNIEFKPIEEPQTRDSSMEAGQLQMMHTDTPASIKKWRDKVSEGYQIVEDNGEGEEGFVIINTQQEPFTDVNLRRALSYATDREGYNEVVDEGVLDIAYGPFKENSPWYAETTDNPTYDPEKAKQLIDEWSAANGGAKPAFTLGIGIGNEPNGQYLKQTWDSVGFDVTIKSSEQSSFIYDAVTGNYQANLWRQFGAPDPDADYLWWTSANAGDGPTGGLTLNIARNKSDCVDKAITTGRESSDLAVRKQAYADLQQCFADEQPYIWLSHTNWIIVAAANVRGITNGPLPDGEPSLPVGGTGDFGGVTRLTMTWLAQ